MIGIIIVLILLLLVAGWYMGYFDGSAPAPTAPASKQPEPAPAAPTTSAPAAPAPAKPTPAAAASATPAPTAAAPTTVTPAAATPAPATSTAAPAPTAATPAAAPAPTVTPAPASAANAAVPGYVWEFIDNGSLSGGSSLYGYKSGAADVFPSWDKCRDKCDADTNCGGFWYTNPQHQGCYWQAKGGNLSFLPGGGGGTKAGIKRFGGQISAAK